MATERRRYRRVPIRVPTRVHGWTSDGAAWPGGEMTATEDVSSSGCRVHLRHPVSQGQVLMLTLPLPKNFREHDLDSTAYQVYAVVRHVESSHAGLLFLGKNPPRGFSEHPGELLFMPGDQAAAIHAPRYPVIVNLRLRRTQIPPGAPVEEVTVTEEIGQEAAVVRTSLPILKGERVELHDLDGAFEGTASVDSVTIGKDNIPRLSLKYTDPDAPERAREWLRRQGIFVEPRPGEPAVAKPPAPARAPTPTQPAIGFERELFWPCEQNDHAGCTATLPMLPKRRVKICTCTCHE